MAGVGARGLQAMVRFTLLVLTVCVAGTHGLYFHIGETEKRCFIEEIPDETMVIGQGAEGGEALCFRLVLGRVPPSLSVHRPHPESALRAPGPLPSTPGLLVGGQDVTVCLPHRQLSNSDVGQTEGGLPAIHPWSGHACRGEGPGRQGKPPLLCGKALADH